MTSSDFENALPVIAREKEQDQLMELYHQRSSELVSITGRRRVGKTFLVDQTFAGKLDFELTGTQNGDRKEQLNNFADSLSRVSGKNIKEVTFDTWQFAFFALRDYLETIESKKKLVIFLDELPWLATHKSGFLSALSYFWNSWASKRNVMVIICGSAASWMIQKVVRHTGGLHNRITKRIELQPFNLKETRTYLESRGFSYDNYSIVELYMAFGGIPFYLKELNPSLSVALNVEAVAMNRSGTLHDEFNRLYPALFDHADRHIEVIRALAGHIYGLDRTAIVKKTTLSNGGGLTKILEELEFSGFIQSYFTFGKKKKNKIYRLIDEYSGFYLKFIEPNRNEGSQIWESLYDRPAYNTWTGYAFENLGLRHLAQIKRALGISGVATASSVYSHKGTKTEQGLQIDLVINRADRAINLCEFKFYNKEVELTKEQMQKLQHRRQRFRELTGVRGILFNTLVTTYGMKKGQALGGVVDQVITIEDLFQEN